MSVEQYYNTEYAQAQLGWDERYNTFQKIARLWPNPSGSLDILDLGCGAGSVSADLVRAGHRVKGLDVMRGALERARQRGLDARYHDLNQPIPFPDASFDALIACDIVEHVFSPMDLLREMHRVLRPQGFVVLMLPLHFDLVERLRILVGLGIIHYEHRLYDPRLRAWDYFHLKFFTPREGQEMVEAAGFRVEKRAWRPIHGALGTGLLEKAAHKTKLLAAAARLKPSLFASAVSYRLVRR